MKQTVDYEAEELARREEQQAAVRAESRRDWKQLGMRFVLYMLLCAAMTFGMYQYFQWLDWDWFTPPAELLTEGEFGELVAGYPLLAEALGGTYSDNTESLTRGEIRYEPEDSVSVYISLHGRYGTMGHAALLREPEPLQYNGR